MDHVAHIILERQFLDDLPVSRDACESNQVRYQAEWNQVNQVFKELGIKGPRSYQVQTFDQALEIWRSRVHIEPDAILIRKEDFIKRITL